MQEISEENEGFKEKRTKLEKEIENFKFKCNSYLQNEELKEMELNLVIFCNKKI